MLNRPEVDFIVLSSCPLFLMLTEDKMAAVFCGGLGWVFLTWFDLFWGFLSLLPHGVIIASTWCFNLEAVCPTVQL